MLEAMNDSILNKKLAVIMGASRGVGRNIGLALASKGVRVAIFDKDGAAGEELVSLLPGSGHLLFIGEMSSRNDLASFAHIVMLQYGHVDYMINCAGSGSEMVELVPNGGEQDVRESARCCLVRMLKRHFADGAVMVNIGSIRKSVSCWETPHKGNHLESPCVFGRCADVPSAVRINHVIPVERLACGKMIEEKISRTVVTLCLSLNRPGMRETVIVDASQPCSVEYYRRSIVNVHSTEPYPDYLAVQ